MEAARSWELTLPYPQPQLLEALDRYWLLTGGQLREAAAPELTQTWVNQQLNRLLAGGLVAYTHRLSSHQRVWYLRREGAEAVGSSRRPPSARRASGALQNHDLDVNEAGLCFLREARRRGHECDWRREVPHSLGSGSTFRRGARYLLADALLEYRSSDQVRFRFIEADRGREMLAELLTKLLGYASLAKQGSGYPVLPPVLVIFSGRPRPYLEGRMQAMRALCTVDPELKEATKVSISFALLEDLQRQGPFAPVFRRPGSSERLNWRGDVDSELRIMA